VSSAAFLAGLVDSIVGGGGLIQVPALFAAFRGIAPQVLLGINKVGSLCGTSSAVLRYARFMHIPWRTLLPAATLAFCAAVLGATLVSAVPQRVFRPLVPVMLASVLLYLLWHKDLGTTHRPIALTRQRTFAALAGIAASGLYDGFFGPGTGSFLMLLFIRLYGFDFLHASASARVINVATNAGALAYFSTHLEMHWGLGLCLGLANAAGSVAGIRIARRYGSRFVRRLFIGVVVALIAKTGSDALTQ